MLYFIYYLMFSQKYFEIHFISEERFYSIIIIICDSNISGYVTFSPLSHTFNNLKCYTCRFLCKNFFYVSPLAGMFFRQVSLAGIFWGILTPPPVISYGSSLKIMTS